MHAVVHAADIQDRDGGVLVMATLFGAYPFLLKLYADGGYAGPQFQAGLAQVMRQVSVEIVKRPDAAKGFAVLPKRWIVGGTRASVPVSRLAQGLGMPEPPRAGVHPPRIHPPHAQETMPDNNMIPDGHLYVGRWIKTLRRRNGR